MTSEDDRGQSEAVLSVATRLFAALGYDSTSIRQIADAAGLDVAELTRRLGGKRDIYLAVMERAFRAEQAALGAAAAELEETGSIHLLFDRYLDFYVANPEIVALWIHRWLMDAVDVAELEKQYVQPLMAMMGKSVGSVLGDQVDIDVEYTLWSVIWCVHGFVKTGVLEADGRLRGPGDPRAMRRFRRHMHQMLHRHVGLPGDPPADGLSSHPS
ncbi:TetR/AcrR family transcriptional regulator [Microbispora sp. NPDC049125]|uniref:TetR/AcrR family transcriptional regulator n=1 Tax=Microbispora sp. NPDC049125 TaxID=3154929 RepID=UPI003465E25A